MLCFIANAARKFFVSSRIYRIGGDEFVILTPNQPPYSVWVAVDKMRAFLREKEYEISVGIQSTNDLHRLDDAMNQAEAAMRHCLPGVFRYGNPQNRIHVTEKPLQLMKDVIQICEPGGLILDPFAGAGTTVLAAVMTGYRAVGIEVTDAYYKLGSDRVKIALEAEQKEDEK